MLEFSHELYSPVAKHLTVTPRKSRRTLWPLLTPFPLQVAFLPPTLQPSGFIHHLLQGVFSDMRISIRTEIPIVPCQVFITTLMLNGNFFFSFSPV